MNTSMKKAISLVTCTALAAGCCTMAFAADSPVTKDENVFLFLNPDGSIQSQVVSDWLHSDNGLRGVTDRTSLTDITNLKSDVLPAQDGENLTWTTEDNDIYYQGTSTKETPVSQTITYSLDGKEVKPEELAGKSGKVTIRFDYTNNETVKTKIDGKEEEIYVPFAAISGMVLDDSFSNVKVTNGKVISDGKNNIVVGYALPGLKESLDVDDSDFDGDVSIPDYVEVTADVENFSLSTTMTVVMNATNFISKDGDADLSEVDDMLDTLTDATDQLKDGSGELADGVDTLKSKMGEFKDGVGTLKNGIKDYTDGASTLSTGIGTLKSGVDTLAGSVPTLISGVGTLKDGSASAAKGASSLKDGAGTLKKGAKDVSTGANTLSNGVKDLSTGANTLSGGASDLSTGADTLSAGATSLSDGANTLSSGASSLNDGVQSIATNMKTLVSGAKQVSDGAASLNAGVSTLIGKLNDMGTTLATNKAGLEAQLQEKGTSLENAQATINALKEVQQSLIQGIAVEGTKPDTAIAIFSQVSQKLNVPISNSIDAASVIASLSDKIATIGQAQGAANVIDTVAGQLAGQDTQEQLTALATGASQLSTGADAAAAGSAQVAQGAADLATGAGTLKTGAADLATGAGTLKKGASDLATGATKLKKGAGDLATGAGKVADGASTLHKGASDLSDGLNTLDGGIGQLKEKAGSLSTGADQLKSGTDQLATGASTLVSNNQKLNDGAGTLSDGTDAIIDGVGELSDGAHKLADGITEFSEDGIDEIINSYNGDIEPLVDRIQAVLDAGADYQTYTDIADGVNGSVKFIIKTDAVKAED